MRQYRMPPSLGIVLSEALKIKIYDHDESDVLLEIDGKKKICSTCCVVGLDVRPKGVLQKKLGAMYQEAKPFLS